MSDSIEGRVYSVLFNQDDYYILNLDRGGKPIKAKGSLFGLKQIRYNTPIKLVGKWTVHQQYGREFSFHSWEPWASTAKDVTEFLSVCIEGCSDLRAVDALVSRYGVDLLDMLTQEPATVLDTALDGIPKEVVGLITLGWETALATRDLSALLKAGGLGPGEIALAMGRFGMEAARVIAANPFRLLEIPGLSYAKIDRLATHLGVDPNDPRRVQGAILWSLQEATKQGHLYLRRGELGVVLGDLMQKEQITLPLGKDPPKTCNDAIVDLLRQKAVILDPEAGLYLPLYHDYERRSAKLLSGMLQPAPLKADTKAFLEGYEKAHNIQLSEAQRQSVELLEANRVLVITGLPGSGKSTVTRALVRLLEESKVSFSLMAPTGIAAKRLSAVTGHPASTVHRALGYDGHDWMHHEDNRFITDAVILDEASMMDQELFYRLVSSVKPETRLVLVGDDAQLPSVGPGNVLHELIESSHIPHIRLTEIFRQAVKGEIVVNSRRINFGQMPELEDQRAESEFRFVRIGDESRIVDLIVEIAQKLKARNANFQVLSPKYDGMVGVNNLNERLRDALNPPGPKEERYGKQTFRRGDRLMVVQNDYKLGVYNGDVGKLSDISREGLIVKIHGVGNNAMDEEKTFKKGSVDKLRLAYAITAHKSQGQEYDTIIMPIVKSQGRMLQRNLLYTAVTRARKRVWLIGEEIAIQKAIENNKVVRRNTVFSRAIEDALTDGGVEDLSGGSDES